MGIFFSFSSLLKQVARRKRSPDFESRISDESAIFKFWGVEEDEPAAVVVYFKKGTSETRGRIGIHILRPDENDLEDSIDQAMNNGFDTIYIYDRF